MKTMLKNFLKSCALVLMVVPLMANQQCEQPQASARKLKKRVDLYGISAQEFTLPGGAKYNLATPVSAQLEVVVNDHPDFYITSRAPVVNEMGLMAADPTPECVRDVPMMMLGGTIPYFEFISSTKVSFGYSTGGDFGNVTISPSIKVDKAQMALLLKAYHPLTRLYTAMGDATSNETKTTINATINFNDFTVSPELYFKTPLEKVSRSALTKALDKLSKDAADMTWTAQVKKDADRYIIINAGKKAGLKKGDELTVHNQLYYWENEGQPCRSPLAYQVDQRPGNPTAIIRLDIVEDDYSISEVDPVRPTDEAAHVGAVVRLKSFASEAATPNK